MPTETLIKTEAINIPEYSHRSFELVFANFCAKYQQKIESIVGPKASHEGRFLGLPSNATVQQMGHRLSEVVAAVGEPPELPSDMEELTPIKEAIIYSARNLAWNAVMCGLTSKYIDSIGDFIKREKYSGKHNMSRLFYEKRAATSLVIAHNTGIRNYFDSGLAHKLGNDSPHSMSNLFEHVSYLSDIEKKALVKGISLEIAAKRTLDKRANGHYEVSYGTSEQDALGGDLVVIGAEDLVFIDLKSKMPSKFDGGEVATDLDYYRGYKWLEGVGEGRQAIVWAHSKEPVSEANFVLNDGTLIANLEAVAKTSVLEKMLV
jgi:hypothetical protein